MKTKIFIDTDVILDLLAKRDPFFLASSQLFTLIDKGKVQAYTSPVVFSNLFYILSKLKSRKFAHISLRKLRMLLNVINVDERIIDFALNSDFKDFEDAIQFYSAKLNDLDFIITRNVKDFISRDLTVIKPDDFLQRFGAIP